MQLAEFDARPRKPAFQLVHADAILGEIRRLTAGMDPKSAPARALVLQHFRTVLADARTSAEAELKATRRHTVDNLGPDCWSLAMIDEALSDIDRLRRESEP